MQIIIKKTNLDLEDKDELLIHEKLGSLDKYFPEIGQVRFEIEKMHTSDKGEVYRAEVNLHITHNMLRVEKMADSWRKAVEKVKDHAKRILSEEKKKMIDKHRRK